MKNPAFLGPFKIEDRKNYTRINGAHDWREITQSGVNFINVL
jgi:hypothetical protein